MADYIIRDYTDCKDSDYKIRTVSSLEELFDELNRAKEDEKIKIAIYEIGDCLLDWS